MTNILILLIVLIAGFLVGYFTNNYFDTPATPATPELKRLDNTDRRFGATDHYYGINLKHKGVVKGYAFTDHDLKRPHERADKNPEDMRNL